MVVAVQQLLDPNARDSQLRAFAYLQARFVKGARNSIDCLQPFVIHAIGQFAGAAFDSTRIAGYIADNYRLSIPIYMLEDMVPTLEELGALKSHKIARVLTCEDITKKISHGHADVDFSLEDIDAVERGLADFAKSKGGANPLSAPTWGQALINFFQAENEPIREPKIVVNGVMIGNPSYLDGRIVGEYILKCSNEDAQNYKNIEKIYYGVLISDFLTKLEQSGNKADYKGLAIFYDATVLMRLLGSSGSKFRAATLEMHETLQDLGCQTYYFNHTFSETLNNIEYLISAAASDRPMHAETRAALDAGEISSSDLTLLLGSLDVALGKLGITEHPETYETKRKDPYQIDERAFVEALKKTGRFTTNKNAAENDAKSIALVMRLREGKAFRDVYKTKAIFITHNTLLASVANRFLIGEGSQPSRSIGVALTVGQMTTLAWLANEIVYEPQKISKELIANCYKGSLPMDGWDAAFWDALKKADPSVAETSHNLIYAHTAREIALHESHGHLALLQKIDMKSALEEAAARSKRVEHEAKNAGFNEGRLQATRDLTLASAHKALLLSRSIARVLVVLFAAVSVIFLFFSFFIFNETPGPINWIARIVAFGVGLLTIVDLFGVAKLKIMERIQGPVLWLITRLQGAITGAASA